MVDFPKPVLFRPNQSQKPYILRIRSNVLRELVSYLTQTEFLEFCTTCKDFIKLIKDKFLSRKIILPNILIPLTRTLVDQIFDLRSLTFLNESQFPHLHIEWKTIPIKFFHYCIFESRKFVFLYQEHSFDVKELNGFSNELTSVYSKGYKDKIFYASGYKNRVIILFRDRVESLKLDQSTVFSNDINEKNVTNVYEIGKEWVKKIKFLNNGRTALLINRNSVHLLNEKMKLLNIHHFPDEEFKYHIPSVYGKTYLTYSVNEVKVWKVGTSQEKTIKLDFKIDYLRTSHFEKSPQMVFSSHIGELYLGKKKLEIRCIGKFDLLNEYIIYSDYCNRANIKLYNLIKNSEIYSIHNSLMSPLCNFFITPYKIIYELDQKIFIENVNTRSKHDLMISFEELYQFKYLNNLVILGGMACSNYGIIVLDLSRTMSLPSYQSKMHLPCS